MIFVQNTQLQKLIVHHVGNKQKDGRYVLSEDLVDLSDEIRNDLLIQFFTQPFTKQQEVFRFHHTNDNLQLNEMYVFAQEIFNNQARFEEFSQHITKYLFEVSTHPNIKSGELYVALFDGIQIEGELHQALGIFKSENKESYLKINPTKTSFSINYEQEAIPINKLDKGCLIFNTSEDLGFKIMIVDQSNKSQEAVYWKDDFLKVSIRNDDYQKTSKLLELYKDFVSERLEESFEISKADKIDLLNRSIHYFKQNESFHIDEFSEQVIADPRGVDLFKNYKREFEQNFDFEIEDAFSIAGEAVKKQSRLYKSVLKLDKNFHIYIHGDKNKIEKGFDEEKGLSYYKVYFDKEA